jgi:DNA-nicking Smr family endonuclease
VKQSLTEQKTQSEHDDAALFHAAIGEVIPLPDQNRISPKKRPLNPMPNSHTTPSATYGELFDGHPEKGLSDFSAENAPSDFLRNGLSRMTFRKLRRGDWHIQNSLDMHGSKSDEARKLFQEFLHEAILQGWRCVLVIHGKGMNSRGGEAVLRKLARHWMTQHPDVLAYCDAPPKNGGSGATLVLLKIAKNKHI